MKSVNPKLLLLCLSICYLFACASPFNKEALYGTWVGKKGEVEVVLKFSRDSTCELEFNDGSNTIRIRGNFSVNFGKKPIPLTIRNIPNLNHPLHTIIEFKEMDQIRMGEFAPRWRLRPISFNRDTEVYFRRSKIT